MKMAFSSIKGIKLTLDKVLLDVKIDVIDTLRYYRPVSVKEENKRFSCSITSIFLNDNIRQKLDYFVRRDIEYRIIQIELTEYFQFDSSLKHVMQNTERLNNYVDILVSKCIKSDEETSREDSVLKFLKIVFSMKVFPSIILYPFGSRMCGLSTCVSDLDVFCDTNCLFNGRNDQDKNSQQKIVLAVYDILCKQKECLDLTKILTARVPIIRFLHSPSQLIVDLSFRNGLACHNTRLVRFYLSLDTRVKKLVLFMKKWCSVNKIHSLLFFSSYSITMLVIFYLQQVNPRVLPTVKELKQNYQKNRPVIFTAGWNCNFSTDTKLIQQTENKNSFQTLLLGFFKYYLEFDYEKFVIPLWKGKMMSRSECTTELKLLLKNDKNEFLNSEQVSKDIRSMSACLCVLDPFEKTHVITKNFEVNSLKIFLHLCQVSLQILKVADN